MANNEDRHIPLETTMRANKKMMPGMRRSRRCAEEGRVSAVGGGVQESGRSD
jgi:hypothetical protein